MSLWRRASSLRESAYPAGRAIPPNSATGGPRIGSTRVDRDTILRASVVWACLRLRADLISTMKVGTFRDMDGVPVPVSNAPILDDPDGSGRPPWEWRWASQFDLDRSGNAIGVITARNALGLPAAIELQDLGTVGVSPDTRTGRKGKWRYRCGSTQYDQEDIWHERAYPLAGTPMGLDPVAYAAFSGGAYLSAQQFALEWFAKSRMPASSFKNTRHELNPEVAAETKARVEAAMEPGGVLVHGRDWELTPITAVSRQAEYVSAMQWGSQDLARYFGVPADLVDAAMSGESITYANLTQRNLQFMIMNFGPAVRHREEAWGLLLPRPRYVKIDRSSVLEMDPKTRAEVEKMRIESRTLAPSEVRQGYGQAPLTPEQLDEFPSAAAPAVPPAGDDDPEGAGE